MIIDEDSQSFVLSLNFTRTLFSLACTELSMTVSNSSATIIWYLAQKCVRPTDNVSVLRLAIYNMADQSLLKVLEAPFNVDYNISMMTVSYIESLI